MGKGRKNLTQQQLRVTHIQLGITFGPIRGSAYPSLLAIMLHAKVLQNTALDRSGIRIRNPYITTAETKEPRNTPLLPELSKRRLIV